MTTIYLSMLETNEIRLELMLGYCVSIDRLDERKHWCRSVGISIETPFHFVKQVYVSSNHVIYFLYSIKLTAFDITIPIMTFCHGFYKLFNYHLV